MADLIFAARITPLSSTAVTATTNKFDVTASIFEGTGQFSALDVAVNDVVFLDTFNSVTAPSSISKYKVVSVLSASVSTVTLRLQYIDTGPPVDPGEVVGNPGFIGRVSALQSFVFHAAPTIHSFPDYVVQYARNQESFAITDPSLGTGASSTDRFKKQMVAGGAFAANVPVAKRADGKVIFADADVMNAMEVIGFSLSSSAGDGSLVDIVTIGPNLIGALSGLGFSTADEIYLSNLGGYTNSTTGFTSSDSIVRVGFADCAAGVSSSTAVDLIAFAEVISRP